MLPSSAVGNINGANTNAHKRIMYLLLYQFCYIFQVLFVFNYDFQTEAELMKKL